VVQGVGKWVGWKRDTSVMQDIFASRDRHDDSAIAQGYFQHDGHRPHMPGKAGRHRRVGFAFGAVRETELNGEGRVHATRL